MAHTQDGRSIAITTPLGKDVLLLEGFSGTEAISQLFRFEVQLLAEISRTIDLDGLLGKNVTVKIKTAAGERYFNGIISRITETGSDDTFTMYRAEVVPTAWLMTQAADCRIFQEMTVPDIIQKVCTDMGVSDVKRNLRGSYPAREYCVHYRETHFDFVSRLMEQYGILYYFEHGAGKHTLVMGDSNAVHQPCPGQSTARFQRSQGSPTLPENVVTSWAREQAIRPAKYALNDYNFETPSANLKVNVAAMNPAPGSGKLEIYDYPGEYVKRPDGEGLVRVRIEEEEAGRATVEGASSCAAFTAGYRFDLQEHPRRELNGSYVLTSVRHTAFEYDYRSTAHGKDGFTYSNAFTCIPGKVTYRPPRVTPRALVRGTQTAEVTGPAGEEIWTDKHGRVKVQFHWDRLGKKDEKSSCWIRVSQPWAGKSWGGIAIPRIGQEVVVDFLEGDPDQPLIVGRVYNGEQVPPYPLPAGQVISGVKSNSTKGGGGYNEISLDDTKGTELITIHGQYNMASTIEHDRTDDIGNDESISIGRNRTETVEKDESITIGGNRTRNVEKDENISVGKNRTKSIGKSESVDIAENRTASVGKKEQVSIGDDRSHQIGKNDTLDVAKNLLMNVGDSITLKAGDASLTMSKDGSIVLRGKDISLDGSGKVNVKAAKDVVVKGSKVLQN